MATGFSVVHSLTGVRVLCGVPGNPLRMNAAAADEERRKPSRVDAILRDQSGVIARRQALAAGEAVWDIRCRVRRRQWVRLLPGVYVDHTGRPSWIQRAWAGVLALWPAALADEAASRVTGCPSWRGFDEAAPIALALAPDRNVGVPPGYLRRRPAGFESRVRWNSSPPRVRLEDAVLDVAVRQPDQFRAVAVLADVCQTRRTTAERIREAMAARARLRRREWLSGVLDDIANGTCSVLEHGYLTRVERAHGLPAGDRQTPRASDRGSEFRGRHLPRDGLRSRAGRAPLPRQRATARRRPGPRPRRGRRGTADSPPGLGPGLRQTVSDGRSAGGADAGARLGRSPEALRSNLLSSRAASLVRFLRTTRWSAGTVH